MDNNYLKNYLEIIIEKLRNANSVYEKIGIYFFIIETNIYKEPICYESVDFLKYTNLLKMLINTLKKGDVYYLNIENEYDKNKCRFCKIIIETYVKAIDKYYLIEIAQHVDSTLVIIDFNEIEKKSIREKSIIPLEKLGYKIFKKNRYVSYLEKLENLHWLSNNYLFNVYIKMIKLNYLLNKIPKEKMEYSIKNKMDDRTIKINIKLNEQFEHFYDKLNKIKKEDTFRFKIIENKIKDYENYFEIILDLNTKIYYIRYLFNEKNINDYNCLLTEVKTYITYEIFELPNYEHCGFIRSKGFYKHIMKNQVEYNCKDYEKAIYLELNEVYSKNDSENSSENSSENDLENSSENDLENN